MIPCPEILPSLQVILLQSSLQLLYKLGTFFLYKFWILYFSKSSSEIYSLLNTKAPPTCILENNLTEGSF